MTAEQALETHLSRDTACLQNMPLTWCTASAEGSREMDLRWRDSNPVVHPDDLVGRSVAGDGSA